jgi:hypothetical protein
VGISLKSRVSAPLNLSFRCLKNPASNFRRIQSLFNCIEILKKACDRFPLLCIGSWSVTLGPAERREPHTTFLRTSLQVRPQRLRKVQVKLSISPSAVPSRSRCSVRNLSAAYACLSYALLHGLGSLSVVCSHVEEYAFKVIH